MNFVAWRGLGDEGRAEFLARTLGVLDGFDSQRNIDRDARRVSRLRKLDLWFGQFVRPMGVVTSMSKDAEGRNVYRAYLVPKEDVELREGTWDTLGLRATSSVDYAITDKSVPAHRTYQFFSEGLAASGPVSAMESVWLN